MNKTNPSNKSKSISGIEGVWMGVVHFKATKMFVEEGEVQKKCVV